MNSNATDPNEIWNRCLLTLEKRVSNKSFKNWFQPTHISSFSDNTLVLNVSSKISADWLIAHYLQTIQEVVYKHTQTNPNIIFNVGRDVGPKLNKIAVSGPDDYKKTEQAMLPLQPEITGQTPIQPPSINSQYTFESIIIGESNQFAHAAAHAVATSPGKTQFNPLFIFGGVGLGKTHLLHAIGNYAYANNPLQNVVCVHSEKFMSDFIDSLKNKNTADFRRLYRSADILLIDDIQFMFMRGEHTQTEFFHTFNEIHQNGKQIVMTCDSPPEKLEGLEERFLSRFQWGLITSIEPPDLETRIAILRQKAEINEITLPHDVAAFLGNYISSNVRDLEGALIHLMAYCSVHNTELSVEAATLVVKERGPGLTSELTIELIQQHVASHFNLPIELLVSKSRKQDIAQARHVAMYLTKRLTKFPLKMIGIKFGNRDHSTVVHAINSIEKKRSLDQSFSVSMDRLSNKIDPQNKNG